MKERRLLSLGLVASSVGGCWTEERVGGVFTHDQLDALRAQFEMPAALEPCAEFPGPRCAVAKDLGQTLFFDKQLAKHDAIACSNCHAPIAWYADPKPFSQGATKLTGRNTISVVNLALKPPGTFTWTGLPTASDVITTIALPKAMATYPRHVAHFIKTHPTYDAVYHQLFPDEPIILPADASALVTDGPDNVVDAEYAYVSKNLAAVFEAYMRQLNSVSTRFDRFIEGELAAMTDQEIRGFAVFAGEGMCIECHSGWMFSDHSFRNTGIEVHAVAPDLGRDDASKFYTAPLRHVAKTGPYMHDGSIGTLAKVVEFYRWGGGTNDAPKDKLMVPLDTVDDDDAADLVAFLEVLTGEPIDPTLTRSPVPGPWPNPLPIAAGETCAMPLSFCASTTTCVDLATDPANCGACGDACASNKPICSGGMCRPL